MINSSIQARLTGLRLTHMIPLMVALVGLVSAQAQTVYNFQEGVSGYSGTSDTYIKYDQTGINWGNSASLSTQYYRNGSGVGQENQNILIRFDNLSSLPASTTVQSATLTLHVNGAASSGGSANVQFLAYQLLTSWTEGSGNNTSGIANWNNATDTQVWQTAGAAGVSDRSATALFTSSTYVVGGTTPTLSSGSLLTIDLPASLIQAWIDSPSTNNGILLEIQTSSNYRYPSVTFDSSEATTDSLRPLLSIVAVPEPTTAACLVASLGCLLVLSRRKK